MSTIYKFRARKTDGTSEIVRGMSTCEPKNVREMGIRIARRPDVQSVKVLAIPNRER